jgi:hypothetical protein
MDIFYDAPWIVDIMNFTEVDSNTVINIESGILPGQEIFSKVLM